MPTGKQIWGPCNMTHDKLFDARGIHRVEYVIASTGSSSLNDTAIDRAMSMPSHTLRREGRIGCISMHA